MPSWEKLTQMHIKNFFICITHRLQYLYLKVYAVGQKVWFKRVQSGLAMNTELLIGESLLKILKLIYLTTMGPTTYMQNPVLPL